MQPLKHVNIIIIEKLEMEIEMETILNKIRSE